MKCKAFLFDLDGVLFESIPFHELAFKTALADWQMPRIDYRLVAGLKTEEAIETLLRNASKTFTTQQVIDLASHKRAIAHELLKSSPPVRKGTKPILENLFTRFKLGLVSSSAQNNVQLFLKASQTEYLFSVIMSAQEGFKSKPSPELFEKALERLGVSADEAVIVEDAVSGIRAGVQAGSRVIGVMGTYTADELKNAGAEAVIHSLVELIEYAKNL